MQPTDQPPEVNPFAATSAPAAVQYGDRSGDATGGIIPYKNPSALIAYYLGLFSLFPVLGFFLGIAAFVLGIMGLRARLRRPEIKGAVHAWIGIVCGFCAMVVWGLTLGAIVIAMFSK